MPPFSKSSFQIQIQGTGRNLFSEVTTGDDLNCWEKKNHNGFGVQAGVGRGVQGDKLHFYPLCKAPNALPLPPNDTFLKLIPWLTTTVDMSWI